MFATRSRLFTFSAGVSFCSDSNSWETTTPQSLKWEVLRVTRSVASFSTSISAERLSILILRPSQSSSFFQAAMVWGFTLIRRAISATEVTSPVRNSFRASSRFRAVCLAMGIGTLPQELLGEVHEPPGFPVPPRRAVAGEFHRLLDDLFL